MDKEYNPARGATPSFFNPKIIDFVGLAEGQLRECRPNLTLHRQQNFAP
jgi:hypothetical protein